ncbi:MAG: hypothetical protein HYX78_11680 [Armatimonadetes bacterium]|nr:hypothetical protein [Armatimonadota bacterium]
MREQTVNFSLNKRFFAALFALLLSSGAAADPVQIGYAKSAGPGWSGSVIGAVTAIYQDYGEYAIEAEDRSAGIIVTPLPAALPQIGEELIVSGVLGSNGKLIASTDPQRTGRTVAIEPLGLSNKTIIGAAGNPGLSNQDLLVSTYGLVLDTPTAFGDGSKRFHITDGSNPAGGPTVTIVDESLVISDDFSGYGNGGNPAGWLEFLGDWEVQNGRYTTRDGGGWWHFALANSPPLSDFVMEYDQTGIYSGGAVLRMENPPANWGEVIILQTFTGNVAFMNINGQQFDPHGWSGGAPQPTETIHVRAEVQGGIFRASAVSSGGSTWEGYWDSTGSGIPAAGSVGFATERDDGAQAFDNVRVTGGIQSIEVGADVVQAIIPLPVTQIPILSAGDYAGITGIASKVATSGSDIRAVRMRDADDFRVFKSVSAVAIQQGNVMPQFTIPVKSSQELVDNRIGGDYGCGPNAVSDVSSLGLKWIRMGFVDCVFNWQDVQTAPGTYYIDPARDQIVTQLANAGFTTVMALGCGDGGSDRPDVTRFKDPQEVTNYCEYARFMAQHFKGRVKYYEIWNEPNVDAPWGWIAAADYSNLVKNAAPVIHQEDPAAKVVMGAIGGRWTYGYPGYGSYGRYTFDLDYLNDILRSGAAPLVDVISWHPFYGHRPDDPYYQNYVQMVGDIKLLAFSQGFRGQFLSEECLWRTEPAGEPQQPVSPTVSAKYLSRSIVMHLGLNVIADVSAMFPGRCREVVPRLCSVLAGATYSSLFVTIQSGASNIKKYTFALPNGDRLIAIWTDGMGVDDDPGAPATVMCAGFSAAKATAIDVLNNVEQGLLFESSGSGTTIKNLLMRDYPLIIRLSPPGE